MNLTKEDLRAIAGIVDRIVDRKLEVKLDKKINELRVSLKTDMVELRADLYRDLNALMHININPTFDEHHIRITKCEKRLNDLTT